MTTSQNEKVRSVNYRTCSTMRLYFHSDVLPADTSAGELLLHRHLFESDAFCVNSSFCKGRSSVFQSPLWDRLKSTRFSKLCASLEYRRLSYLPSASVIRHARDFDPQLVITVAHGRKFVEAHELSKILEVPLVTIYHDWWPDLVAESESTRSRLDRVFLETYRKSDLALPICDGMLRHLGEHPNVQVLPPIPATIQTQFENSRKSTEFQVCYAGNLFHYGPMIGELLQRLRGSPFCKLVARGAAPNWPLALKNEMTESGNYLPPAARSQITPWVAGFDAHLCAMQFDQVARRRMETSFPSKLVDSFAFGKPVIVWGPEYCSAIQWAKGKDAVLSITNPSPQFAANEILSLARNEERQQHLSRRSRELAECEFNRERIQSIFVSAITRLLG